MIIPVRCLSCGKPIGHLWEKFKAQAKTTEPAKKVLDSLGLKRYCCRSVFLGHVDLIDVAAEFKKDWCSLSHDDGTPSTRSTVARNALSSAVEHLLSWRWKERSVYSMERTLEEQIWSYFTKKWKIRNRDEQALPRSPSSRRYYQAHDRAWDYPLHAWISFSSSTPACTPAQRRYCRQRAHQARLHVRHHKRKRMDTKRLANAP